MQVNNFIQPSAKPIAEPAVASAPATDDDGFGFDDFLDVINPLQHLPVVGSLYRAITGDEIEAPAQLAGGALFGGLYGFLGALGNVAFEGLTGESLEKTVMSLFEGESKPSPELAQRAYQSAQTLAYEGIERSPVFVQMLASDTH